MADQNIQLKSGVDNLFPKTKTSLIENDGGLTVDYISHNQQSISLNTDSTPGNWVNKKGKLDISSAEFATKITANAIGISAMESLDRLNAGEMILQGKRIELHSNEGTRLDSDQIFLDSTNFQDAAILSTNGSVLSKTKIGQGLTYQDHTLSTQKFQSSPIAQGIISETRDGQGHATYSDLNVSNLGNQTIQVKISTAETGTIQIPSQSDAYSKHISRIFLQDSNPWVLCALDIFSPFPNASQLYFRIYQLLGGDQTGTFQCTIQIFKAIE